MDRPPRDTYRSRVYAAEESVYANCGWGKPFDNTDEIHFFIHNIVKSRWFNSYLDYLGDEFPFENVWVVGPVGRNQKSAMAFQWEHVDDKRYPFISFPNDARVMCEMIALHELAHIITPRKYAFHGKQWAERYLYLVGHVVDDEIFHELDYQLQKSGVFGK